MASVVVAIRENADGTLTCRYGKHKASFKPEPWMTEQEILDRVKWELVSCGASLQKETVTRLR